MCVLDAIQYVQVPLSLARRRLSVIKLMKKIKCFTEMYFLLLDVTFVGLYSHILGQKQTEHML